MCKQQGSHAERDSGTQEAESPIPTWQQQTLCFQVPSNSLTIKLPANFDLNGPVG